MFQAIRLEHEFLFWLFRAWQHHEWTLRTEPSSGIPANAIRALGRDRNGRVLVPRMQTTRCKHRHQCPSDYIVQKPADLSRFKGSSHKKRVNPKINWNWEQRVISKPLSAGCVCGYLDGNVSKVLMLMATLTKDWKNTFLWQRGLNGAAREQRHLCCNEVHAALFPAQKTIKFGASR